MRNSFLDFLCFLAFCIVAPILLSVLWIFCKLCELKEGMLFYSPKKGCKECGGEMVEEGYYGYRCKTCNWRVQYLKFGG